MRCLGQRAKKRKKKWLRAKSRRDLAKDAHRPAGVKPAFGALSATYLARLHHVKLAHKIRKPVHHGCAVDTTANWVPYGVTTVPGRALSFFYSIYGRHAYFYSGFSALGHARSLRGPAIDELRRPGTPCAYCTVEQCRQIDTFC